MNKRFNVFGIILSIILFQSCEDKPVIPSLTTAMATEISATTAKSGGTITKDGGAQIVTGGVCWNTSADPTTENNRTIEGGDLSSFTSNITQLSPNTIYYLRAYATNSAGTGYGKLVSFKTLGEKPSSGNINTSNITLNSATVNSYVNANLLPTTVTYEYGVTISYGSTATVPQNPVTGNSNVSVSADLTGLTPGTTYHFRIKAENSLGTYYSDDMSFKTLGNKPSNFILTSSAITINSVSLGGYLNPNYLSTTVSFDWGTTTSYGNNTVSAQNPVTSSASVYVSTDLTGLAPGTTYHFRIKAENSLGLSYSSDMSFTTQGALPSLVPEDCSKLKLSSVTLNGTVNPNYLPTVVSFEWGTTTGYGNSVDYTHGLLTGPNTIDITTNLTGLLPETTYHFRIKATNSLGTTYSSDMTFTTFAIEDIDQNLYHTVIIGSQTFLQENLNTTRYSNGDPIGTTNPATADISAESNPKYQWAYEGNEDNVNVYGRLYTWHAVVDIRNVCPTGWHVPTENEWITMINFLGGIDVTGRKIKEPGTTHWYSTNSDVTNESGFTGLPAGARFFKEEYAFAGISFMGSWWTSTPDNVNLNNAWVVYVGNTENNINHGCWQKKNGYSVRCIKD